MGAPPHWVGFLFFFKRTADVLVHRLRIMLRRLVLWVVSWLAGDRPMSPIFRRVHCPPL